MPSLKILALFCDAAYKNVFDGSLFLDWSCLGSAAGTPNSLDVGYWGIAYKNDLTREIVVIHRGTKIYHYNEKWQLNSLNGDKNIKISSGNLLNDAILALGYVSPETKTGFSFVLELVARYPNYRFIQVGHSLGAFHANIIGYFFRHWVVGFETPGCKEALNKTLVLVQEFSLNLEQLEKHYNFLAEENLINTSNTQIGRVYRRAVQKMPATLKWCTTDPVHTLKTHPLERFITILAESTKDFAEDVPPTFEAIEPIVPVDETHASCVLM